MVKKLTDKEVDKRIFDLVGNEYTKLGEYVNNSIKFKIRHNKCEYEYEVRWGDFQQGKRCPKCSKIERDKKKTMADEEINKRIFDLVGDEYTKLSDYVNSGTKFKIRHNKCNYEYEVSWGSFQQGGRCPKCYGNIKLTDKEIDKIILDLVGDEYIKLSEYVNSKTKFKIRHNECGCEYKVEWASFQRGNRCPKCKESKGEKAISNILEKLDIPYTSQQKFKNCKYKRELPFDFYIEKNHSKLLIEFDGRQHFEPVSVFGGEREFKDTQLRDSIKNDFAKANKIPLLRISYLDQDNIEEILTSKLKELKII